MPLVSAVIPTFNNGACALVAARLLLAQRLPESTILQIVIVDDGSKDDSFDLLSAFQHERVSLLRLKENRGRSAACNEGAQHSKADVILFMDADCRPATDDYVAKHLACLSRGFVASLGHVIGTGGGFWDRYQGQASVRRERQHRGGIMYAGTSTNFAASLAAFNRVGGFDTHFRHYGFEDRDLLIRLMTLGDIGWTNEATVRHLASLSLPDICRKMVCAGQFSARHFAALHPDEYAVLGYGAIDARRHPSLRPVGRLVAPILPHMAECIGNALDQPWLPFPVAKLIVMGMSALSFLHGTTLSRD